MSFRCPSCGKPTLEITKSVELAPSDEFDEIAVQALKCGAWTCRFVGIAVYTESRRGSLNSERVTHTGYAMLSGDLGKNLGRVALLVKKSDWEGLLSVTGKSFAMTMAGE